MEPQSTCPKLNHVVKGNISKDTKEADRTLVKLQTLVIDAVAPLMHMLEEAQSGKLTNDDTSVKASKLTLSLLGNASAHISKVRRKKTLKDLNKHLLTLAKDDELFSEAAPLLFGDGFEKVIKEHV